MPKFALSNKADLFNAATTPNFTSGSEVYGLNGKDQIDAITPQNVRNWEDLFLDGGNGDDYIVTNAVTSTLKGGNGDDLLKILPSISNWGNTLDGGNGDDTLDSFSSSQLLGGNFLIGGAGKDTFILNNETYIFTDAAGGADGVISQGDRLAGSWDRITDYQAGESLVLGITAQNTALELKASNAGEFIPNLSDGQYAVVRGNDTSSVGFEVNAAGQDLLIIYDKADGIDPSNAYGGVVLLGYTDLSGLLVA